MLKKILKKIICSIWLELVSVVKMLLGIKFIKNCNGLVFLNCLVVFIWVFIFLLFIFVFMVVFVLAIRFVYFGLERQCFLFSMCLLGVFFVYNLYLSWFLICCFLLIQLFGWNRFIIISFMVIVVIVVMIQAIRVFVFILFSFVGLGSFVILLMMENRISGIVINFNRWIKMVLKGLIQFCVKLFYFSELEMRE